MITFIFWAVFLGVLIAVIIGTLGEEIQGLLFRFMEVAHPEDRSEMQLRKYYQEIATRSRQ